MMRPVGRILVCDDNELHFAEIRDYLSSRGFSVSRAFGEASLVDALTNAHRTRKWFDLVMIDLDLSGAGEPQRGDVLYYKVAPEFPNEAFVIYTSQDLDSFRAVIGDLWLRRVQGLVIEPGTMKEGLSLALTREIRPAPEKVFLVHGRGMHKKLRLESFLEKGLGLSVVDWEEAREAVRHSRSYNFEIVVAGMELSRATVVLFTDDEKVALRKARGVSSTARDRVGRGQSRANVFIEAGFAQALRPNRTIFVEWPSAGSEIDRPSDFDGFNVVQYDDSESARETLRRRLEASRCSVRAARNYKKADFGPP